MRGDSLSSRLFRLCGGKSENCNSKCETQNNMASLCPKTQRTPLVDFLVCFKNALRHSPLIASDPRSRAPRCTLIRRCCHDAMSFGIICSPASIIFLKAFVGVRGESQPPAFFCYFSSKKSRKRLFVVQCTFAFNVTGYSLLARPCISLTFRALRATIEKSNQEVNYGLRS